MEIIPHMLALILKGVFFVTMVWDMDDRMKAEQ